MSTMCNRLDLETLGIWSIMPNIIVAYPPPKAQKFNLCVVDNDEHIPLPKSLMAHPHLLVRATSEWWVLALVATSGSH
jgi:hypothetical protein